MPQPHIEISALLPQGKPLSFLHVFHHATVVVMAYLWLAAGQSLQQIALLTNTGVHVVMYWCGSLYAAWKWRIVP